MKYIFTKSFQWNILLQCAFPKQLFSSIHLKLVVRAIIAFSSNGLAQPWSTAATAQDLYENFRVWLDGNQSLVDSALKGGSYDAVHLITCDEVSGGFACDDCLCKSDVSAVGVSSYPRRIAGFLLSEAERMAFAYLIFTHEIGHNLGLPDDDKVRCSLVSKH